MNRKSVPYEEELYDYLQDPENAAGYLTAIIEDGDREAFLLALRHVAQARGGMTAVAEKAHLGRESLYKMLSAKGNPEFKSIASVLHGMGLRLTVEPEAMAA
jgi:probable addiction module antidote protein